MEKLKGATEILAKFVATTGIEDISKGIIENAKFFILDSLGVTLAGSIDAACRILSQWVKDQGASPQATVIGQGFQTVPMLAAFANGHAAHVLDYDEGKHQSTHTLPAALAIGEPVHISGAKFLQAYILGHEIGHRLDAAFDAAREHGGGPTHRGWHHTGTTGSLAAAASAGVILGLNVSQMRTAFGIAAQGAAGLRANMGTMTKALISGNAARNGVMAASLVRRGLTAEQSILEAPQGFAQAFCLEGEVDWNALTRDIGNRYAFEGGLATKEYPCCNPAHRPIEALLKLIKEHCFQAEDVDRIECDPHSFSMRIQIPNDAHEGQYSLMYCLSVALIDGKVGLDQMSDERVRASDVQALMSRIKMVPLKAGPLLESEAERLTVYLRDGRSLTETIEHPRRLRTVEEIEVKFYECSLRAIPKESAFRLKDAILSLDDLPDITTLLDHVRGGLS